MKVSVRKKDLEKLLHDAVSKPTVAGMRWKDAEAAGRSRFYLVAAPPKSGSTWVTSVLAKLLGARGTRFCYAWSSNEHDFYPPALLANAGTRSIAQMHVKATPHNVQLIADFGIRTVLLTRNVFDTVVSLARDLEKKRKVETRSAGLVGYSFAWLDGCGADWGLDRWIDYSIDFYLPWYVNFLSSWSCYRQSVGAIELRYETLYVDPDRKFAELARKLGGGRVGVKVDLKRDAIQSAAISSTHSEIGAGLKLLNKRQHRAIVRMMETGNPYVTSHLDHPTR